MHKLTTKWIIKNQTHFSVSPGLSNTESRRPMWRNSKGKKKIQKDSNLDQIRTCKSQIKPNKNQNPKFLSNFEPIYKIQRLMDKCLHINYNIYLIIYIYNKNKIEFYKGKWASSKTLARNKRGWIESVKQRYCVNIMVLRGSDIIQYEHS